MFMSVNILHSAITFQYTLFTILPKCQLFTVLQKLCDMKQSLRSDWNGAGLVISLGITLTKLLCNVDHGWSLCLVWCVGHPAPLEVLRASHRWRKMSLTTPMGRWTTTMTPASLTPRGCSTGLLNNPFSSVSLWVGLCSYIANCKGWEG